MAMASARTGGLLADAINQSPDFAQGFVGGTGMPTADSPDLLLVGNASLLAATPVVTVTPKVLGIIIGQTAGFDSDLKPEVAKYTVEHGDTPASVAQKFSISLNTVLWANNLSKSSRLKEGTELLILPVSGVLHLVKQNETLGSIAALYRVKAGDIADFNQLDSERIFVGDLLIIPNGTMPRVIPQSSLTPVADSYFIWPIPAPHKITQGLHAFNAVDISNQQCGDPVFAAAGGIVQRVGFTSVGGNYARILHPNGVVTYYGHLSAIGVSADMKVMQGQTIGYVGYTGYTIPRGPQGCHVHFEVRGAANPFVRF